MICLILIFFKNMSLCVCEINYVAVSFSSFVGVLMFFFLNQLFLSIKDAQEEKNEMYEMLNESEEEDEKEEKDEEENSEKENSEKEKDEEEKDEEEKDEEEKDEEENSEKDVSLTNLVISSDIPVTCMEFTKEMEDYMKIVKENGPAHFFQDDEEDFIPIKNKII